MSCEKCRTIYREQYQRVPPCLVPTEYVQIIPGFRLCHPYVPTEIRSEVEEALRFYDQAFPVAFDGWGAIRPSEVITWLKFQGADTETIERVIYMLFHYQSLKAKDESKGGRKAN